MRPVSKLSALFLLTTLTACIATAPEAREVRTTSNPEVIRGCTFLGNVRALSGWGGGIAAHNTEVRLREKTAKLGGNVVFVVVPGVHATGEAYRCPPAPASESKKGDAQ